MESVHSYTHGTGHHLDYTDQICTLDSMHSILPPCLLLPPQPLLIWWCLWIMLGYITAWESQPVRTVSSWIGGICRKPEPVLPVRHGRNNESRYDCFFISIHPPKECVLFALTLCSVTHTWHLPSPSTSS